jgi:putative ABC transport system permease protein
VQPILDPPRPGIEPNPERTRMSFLLEIIGLGLNNLRLHILRSILTALGIILGVAAVITMAAIGNGATRSALDDIERLGARNIIIRSVRPAESQQGQGSQSGWVVSYGLKRDDLAVIRATFPEVDTIVPLKSVGSQVLRNEIMKTSQAFGTTPDLLRVARLRVAKGRYLNDDDLAGRESVAVLGSELAREMFPFEDPLGKSIRIDQQVFTVVGVLMPVGLAGGAGSALVGRDLNHDMHIPLTTAESRFGDMVIRRGSGSMSAERVEITEIYFESLSRDRVLSDGALLRRLLEVRTDNMKGIDMIVPFELLETARKRALTGNIVTAAIAGIALLVGGIGIMNIMLASVTERTREIGVRRALGATRRHIIAQFLVETGVLSSIGGVIGIVLGVGLALAIDWGVPLLPQLPLVGPMVSTDVQLPTALSAWPVLVSFGVASATGLVFGIYPARVAARQDPIVALRHD